MALKDVLSLQYKGSEKAKLGVTEDRARKVMPILRSYIAFWREYPDLMIDFMLKGRDSEKKTAFSLMFYQRCFLRIAIRYKYVYGVFPRGWSKSFLAVMILMVRAVLYPRAKLFSTAGGKNQAASILQEKVSDIC